MAHRTLRTHVLDRPRSLRVLAAATILLAALSLTRVAAIAGAPGTGASDVSVAVPDRRHLRAAVQAMPAPEIAPVRAATRDTSRVHAFASGLLPVHEARARLLFAALPVDAGNSISQDDLKRAAAVLGVGVGDAVDATDVERMIDQHRARAAGALRALGMGWGNAVGDDDIQRLARRVGLGIGRSVEPVDVNRVVSAVGSRARVRPLRAASAGAAAPTGAFASIAGVDLAIPSRHVRLIGFHQASYGVARNLLPARRPGMTTLPSRGRPTGKRSAADISVRPNTAVYAPVSGRVVEVRHYRLYGRYADTRIRIVPDQNPGMLVTVLHVTGPQVRVGSRVSAGSSVLAAKATQFPFASQIDRFAGRSPHVHVEARAR